ncbi:hypothetical protein D4F80_14865 [Salmonella enterica subsp. enterica serovar Adabraka]|nr:hypothetical protein [Salmonella enterica subsp. enterica serovar Adabraka]HAD6750975.1 hypothetical protein [Salmonella enterica subsp. enterica serovar Typhimurium str. SL1344]
MYFASDAGDFASRYCRGPYRYKGAMLAMPGASFRREASKGLSADSVLQAGMYRAAIHSGIKN